MSVFNLLVLYSGHEVINLDTKILQLPYQSVLFFSQGRHALVYDIGTPNESLEWVDFKEVLALLLTLNLISFIWKM